MLVCYNFFKIFKDLITFDLFSYLYCIPNTSLICGTGASVFLLLFYILISYLIQSYFDLTVEQPYKQIWGACFVISVCSVLNQPTTNIFINPISECAVLNETVINVFTHPPFRTGPNLPADYINLNLQSKKRKPSFSGEFRRQKALY